MDVVAGGIRFLVRGGWLVQGGWPLVVGGVCGWSARWLPSHSLVLFVHGGLWPGGAGWWAVVVVGVVFSGGGGGAAGGGGVGSGGVGVAGMALGPLVGIPVPLVGVGGLASCVAPGAALCGRQEGPVGARA